MNAYRYGLALMACAMVVVGCDNSNDPADTAEPDQTDGRMTITTDESRLNERVTVLNDHVSIDTTLRKARSTTAFNLSLIGEVEPPTVGGQKLQATSVTLDGDYAIVTYGMAGPSAIGAVDVIQVKKGFNAQIKSGATFTDTDVNAGHFDDSFVYLAEATNNPSFDPLTAVVEKIGCKSGKLALAGSVRRGLASFVATSAHVAGSTLYVTTGNTGYLYRFNASTMQIIDSTSLADARWVDTDGTSVAIVQGTPGRLNVRSSATGAQSAAYTFSGATIAESKSTVEIIGGKALVAAGDGGVKLINLSTGTVVGSLPRVTVSGLDPSVTVTNAASASGPFVFASNGEAGVYVAEASQNLGDNSGDTPITLTSLGKLKFADLQSVNHVSYNGDFLIVASGLGGVKIVRVTF